MARELESTSVSGFRRPFRDSIFERVTNAVTQRALDKAGSKIPQSARKHLPLARKLLSGGVDGLIGAGLDGLFERFGINGTTLATGVESQPSQLIGGITMAEARRRFEEHVDSVDPAKKNLWNIRVRNIKGGDPLDINLFALDVSYAPFQVQGDAVMVGSGSFDNVTNADRCEMRVTTLDDTSGTVKRWFAERHDTMCHQDGTFGLPIEYLFRVDVLHAYIDEQIDGAAQGWTDSFVMRLGALDFELSRRESGLQEIQMTFVQWDTFANLT